jgi:hypothetical protein
METEQDDRSQTIDDSHVGERRRTEARAAKVAIRRAKNTYTLAYPASQRQVFFCAEQRLNAVGMARALSPCPRSEAGVMRKSTNDRSQILKKAYGQNT